MSAEITDLTQDDILLFLTTCRFEAIENFLIEKFPDFEESYKRLWMKAGREKIAQDPRLTEFVETILKQNESEAQS